MSIQSNDIKRRRNASWSLHSNQRNRIVYKRNMVIVDDNLFFNNTLKSNIISLDEERIQNEFTNNLLQIYNENTVDKQPQNDHIAFKQIVNELMLLIIKYYGTNQQLNTKQIIRQHSPLPINDSV